MNHITHRPICLHIAVNGLPLLEHRSVRLLNFWMPGVVHTEDLNFHMHKYVYIKAIHVRAVRAHAQANIRKFVSIRVTCIQI